MSGFSPNEPNYEVCPKCDGTGRVMAPGTTDMITCEYCNGIGVVAFVNDPMAGAEELKMKMNAKDVTENEFKDYFKHLGITALAYIISNLIQINIHMNIGLFGLVIFWAFINSAIISFMTLIYVKYLPRLNGLAQFENDITLIERSKQYLEEVKIMFWGSVIISSAFAFFNILLTFPLQFILFTIIAIKYGIELYNKRVMNNLISALFIILDLILILILIMLYSGINISNDLLNSLFQSFFS